MIKTALERAQARVPSPRDQILKVYGYLLDLQRVIATAQQLFALVAGEEMARAGFRYYRDAVGFLLKHYQKIVDLLPQFIDKVMEKNPGAGMGHGGKTPSSMHTGMNNVRSQAASASKSSNPNPWVRSS